MKRRNFLYYGLLFVGGCTLLPQPARDRDPSRRGNRPETLRFTVTDRNGMEELQRDYEPFRQELARVLNKKIEFFPTENYTAAASALQLDRVDLVLAGPSEYVVIQATTNAVPLISITRPNWRSLIVVREDSGIESLTQLQGKTIAMGAIGGTSSHLAPTKFLIDAGLNPNTDVTIRMLGTEGFSGLEELKTGQVDAWGGASHRYENFLEAEGTNRSAYPPLVTGRILPGDVLVANSKLAPDFIEQLRERMLKNRDPLIEAILATPNNQKYRQSQIVRANDVEYELIRKVYKTIGQGDFMP